MEDTSCITAENASRALVDSLLTEAGQSEPGQFEEAKAILRRAHEAGFPSSTKLRIIAILVSHTKIPFPAYKAALQEIENSHPIHGLVQTINDAVKALHAHFADKYGTLIYADNLLHGYVAVANDEEVGTYRQIAREELDKIIKTLFPFPAWASKRARGELIDGFHDSCHDDGAFHHAIPGLALMNGFLSVDETGRMKLVEFDPDHYARSKLDARYDPEASAPRFGEMLLRAFGNVPEKVELFLAILSCAVFGQMPTADRLRTCLLLIGPMRTGKSTLIRVARMFFSDSVLTSIPPESWGKPEHISALATSSLNTVSELSAQRKLNGNSIKMILSREPVLARLLYQNPTSIVPRGLNIWAGNALPRLDEQDASLGRRFAIIEMGESLTDEEASVSLEETVDEEIAGVINLLANAHRKVMEAERFSLVDEQQESLVRMQYGEDVIASFVLERIVKRPGAKVTTASLKLEIPRFARARGETEPLMTTTDLKRFSSMVKNLYGAERRAPNGRPQYDGIDLVSHPVSGEVATGEAGLDQM